MFTGIIEATGRVKAVTPSGSGVDLVVEAAIAPELKIDQSLSHNGVCLTVVGIKGDNFSVTAIAETLSRTNLGGLQAGDLVNLERSMLMNGRIDGHLVQGHVDATGICESVTDMSGSWIFRFSFPERYDNLIVDKGSICINGVSLTVVQTERGSFTVAVIPYTFEHTNFKNLLQGSVVNLEFDVLGKYVLKSLGRL